MSRLDSSRQMLRSFDVTRADAASEGASRPSRSRSAGRRSPSGRSVRSGRTEFLGDQVMREPHEVINERKQAYRRVYSDTPDALLKALLD